MYLWRTLTPNLSLYTKCLVSASIGMLLSACYECCWISSTLNLFIWKTFQMVFSPKTLFCVFEILLIESWSGGLNSLFSSWTISVSLFILLIFCGSLFGLWILETFCTFKIWQRIFYWGCLYHVICFWSSVCQQASEFFIQPLYFPRSKNYHTHVCEMIFK